MTETPAQDLAAGPGGRLRAARQAMNVECREVADALNLPLSMVQAIEDNDYAQMPNLVFARGYVRSYAKLLELDPEPLVQSFKMPQETVSATHPTATADATGDVKGRIAALLHDNPTPLVIGIAALCVVLLFALLGWLVFGGEESAPTTAAPRVQAPQSAAPGSAAQPDAASVQPAAAAPEPVAQPPSSAPLAPTTTATDAADTLEATVVRMQAGDDVLQFDFTEECWVEIWSAGGDSLYRDLGRPGQRLRLLGTRPFRVQLGYAPGATMRFNDEAVALGPHTRNHIANLVVGQ